MANRYANTTEQFGQKFPPGTYPMTAIYQFLNELTTGTNGYKRDPALLPDMHIDDPDERQASILRKLNSAGPDANLRITDQKNGTIHVQSYGEFALEGASPQQQLDKLERLIKNTDKKQRTLGNLKGLSEADADKAAIRKEALTKLVEEAQKTVEVSKEFNFLALCKHLSIAPELARKMLPHMDELMGTSKKR